MSKALGIEYHLPCFWRPQSSEKVEKANAIIKRHLHKLTQETQDTWFKFYLYFYKGSNCPQKWDYSLWQVVFVRKYCHRSWSLKINCYSAFSFTTDITRRSTTHPAFESNKHLLEPGMEMCLKIYVGLLLLTPKVLNLPFDPQDNTFLSRAHSYTAFHNWSNCWVCRVLPSLSIEDFPWWVSPLQGKYFLQLCDDI